MLAQDLGRVCSLLLNEAASIGSRSEYKGEAPQPKQMAGTRGLA